MDAGKSVATPVEQTPSDELRKSIAANLLQTQQQLATMSSSLAYGGKQRDSFCDFLDAQRPRALDRMSTRLTTARRDSFDWDALQAKQNNEEQRQSICATGSGLSSLDSADSLQRKVVDEANIQKLNLLKSLAETLSGPLRDRSNISGEAKLKKIAETDEHSTPLHEVQSANCSAASSCAGSDKENPNMAEVERRQRLRLLPASRNSTPHHAAPVAAKKPIEMQPQQLLPKTSSGLSTDALLPDATDGAELAKELAEVRKEHAEVLSLLDERFVKLEKELKWSDEKTRFLLFSEMANYWQQQLNITQEIRETLDLLLRKDRFVHEFACLQRENEELREQLELLLSVREGENA